jgi:hypothetical protein
MGFDVDIGLLQGDILPFKIDDFAHNRLLHASIKTCAVLFHSGPELS